MYAVVSFPFESTTRATLRSAEFGFFGVIVLTMRQTPRFCGQFSSSSDLLFLTFWRRPLRTNWLIVGTRGRVNQPGVGLSTVRSRELSPFHEKATVVKAKL